ncbi:uncharacterized protein FSUBG_1723 [Fusarium subglutinans]|uniref:Uncharacterized protein n=1 Tax=Gibberella subglutinans TaxID=42677 RepID=A0A8H5QCA5_GIBSU|nr:uncharacterized protein FSUBG_1723 [Fusarium subglutinans]KAF5612134.1 hypothetical protein FSUBG_1723 [Fusarium subglutinans]
MEADKSLLNTLRNTLGLSNLQDVSQLAQVSQDLLEQKFAATPEGFPPKRMARIYMRWLIHQDFTIEERPQSQVVEQWVSFMVCWGLNVEDAIAIWAKDNDEQHQFLILENTEPIRPPSLVEEMPPPLRNHNFKTRGQIRKFDEHANDAKIKSALENWPTKDIPFSSIETVVDTDAESEEAEETTSLDIKGEDGEAPAEKKARLDTGGGNSPRLVLKGSGTTSSPIDLTE